MAEPKVGAMTEEERVDQGAASTEPPTTRAGLIRRFARAAFLVGAVVACAVVVWRTRRQFLTALSGVSAGPLLLALVAAVLAGVLPMLVWRVLIADLGSSLPLGASARIYFVSALGKYIPGSVWTFVAQVELAREHRVPVRRSGSVALLTIITAAASAAILVAVTLPFSTESLRRDYWWVVLILPPTLVLLHPAAVRWWSRLLFRVVRRPADSLALSGRALAISVGWMVLSWILYGVQMYALVADAAPSGAPLGVRTALQCTGVFALAWVAGLLFFIVPAGAGVREVIIVVGLASVLPSGAALAVALLSRAVLIITDLLLAGAAVLGYRLRGPRPVGGEVEAISNQPR